MDNGQLFMNVIYVVVMKTKDDVSDEIIVFLFNSKNIKRISLSFFHVSIAVMNACQRKQNAFFVSSAASRRECRHHSAALL